MINKKSLWFLTLFSLILVLSVYYITMPSELLLTNNNVMNVNKTTDESSESEEKSETKEEESEKESNTEESKKETKVTVKESEILTALRVEADEQMLTEMEDLKMILTNIESTTDEKNNAFEKMKLLNVTRGEEEQLENKIKEEFSLKAFVKIDGDQIRVVVASDKEDAELANNIMRSIQSNYDKKMYISVKFQK